MKEKWTGILLSLVIGFSHTGTAQSAGQTQLKLFLCGDVMTGRGIDQALPTSVDPVLYESFVTDARDYIRLAERKTGNLDTPLSYRYIWGDALEVWDEERPSLKLVNLETSITTYEEPWPGKGINYRMHPANVKLLTVAGIDHCSLANNHVMDWGRPGLKETMETLERADISFSGVGDDIQEAKSPAFLRTEKNRVLVFSYGSPTSGVPREWAAGTEMPGVNLLPEQSEETFRNIKDNITKTRREGDVVIFSVHWGGNWGYEVAGWQTDLAHRLIDEAGVDVVFGHSSHHPMGMEVYKEKLIIYGAGDFINDYEGISGHEKYRGELTLMYFPEIDPTSGNLEKLKLVPMKIRNFKLNRVSGEEVQWVEQMLNREGEKFGTGVRREGNMLWLEW